jgi:limonene-1,2-epoxide hydrolase
VSDDRFARAVAAIDAANAADPNVVSVRDRRGPKEVVHAELVTEWVHRLRPDASEALLLAARGHHLRRWTVPRDSYPAGRAGYLRWRTALHEQHATELGALLHDAGYDDATVARVQAIVRKERLATDPEVQTFEDALCLVFLETQLTDVASRLEPATLRRVLAKTAAKMSDDGRAAIAELVLGDDARAVLDAAIGVAAPVHAYLDALARHDWRALAATLAAGVERIGPYGDVYRGRDEYAAFLERTVTALPGHRLEVDRVVASGPVVLAELSETVDDGDARLRTAEAVVFDVRDGEITRVAVYLRSSERVATDGRD